jgi:hypothetical protein
MIVQIALGIVLAVILLIAIFKTWITINSWLSSRGNYDFWKNILIAGTIIAIPSAYASDSPIPVLAFSYGMVFILGLGLVIWESIPSWIIKLIECVFLLMCVLAFALVFGSSPPDETSQWWFQLAFFLATAVWLLFSTYSLIKMLKER